MDAPGGHLRPAAGRRRQRMEPDPVRRRVLAQLLYHLGRWIYLTDAADDLAQGRQRSGSYNPRGLCDFRLTGGQAGRRRAARQLCPDAWTAPSSGWPAAFELLECGVWQPVIGERGIRGLYQRGQRRFERHLPSAAPEREKYPERKAGHGDARSLSGSGRPGAPPQTRKSKKPIGIWPESTIPDNYHDNPLADLAQEKMKEINAAYEEIQNQRERGASGRRLRRFLRRQPTTAATLRGLRQPSAATASSAYELQRPVLCACSQAHIAIQAGDLSRAEALLDDYSDHNAEWNFLKGAVCYQPGLAGRGQALLSARPSRWTPATPEYRQALDHGGGPLQTATSPAGYSLCHHRRLRRSLHPPVRYRAVLQSAGRRWLFLLLYRRGPHPF